MKKIFVILFALLLPLTTFAQRQELGTGTTANNSGATQICFWTNDGSDGTITVSLDGKEVGTLTRHWLWPQKPDWGEDAENGGTLVVDTTPGTHSFHAVGSNISWDGSITLAEGDQTREFLRVTQLCFWSNIGDQGNISIQVDGKYVGYLNTHFTYDDPSEHPVWGNSGTLVVTVTAGSHTVYAQGQGTNYFYWGPFTVSIDAGEQKFEHLK